MVEWIKAVWLEDGNEVEGTVPSNWVLGKTKKVAWPSNKKRKIKAFNDHESPADNWL